LIPAFFGCYVVGAVVSQRETILSDEIVTFAW
jgi:hypothetical protein